MMMNSLGKILGIATSCAVLTLGSTAMAQPTDLPAPTGSFTFSGFGSADAADLPLEISDESPVFPVLDVTDLGVTPNASAVEVQTSRSANRITENTWAIGVFR